jgi:hypothetical protein
MMCHRFRLAGQPVPAGPQNWPEFPPIGRPPKRGVTSLPAYRIRWFGRTPALSIKVDQARDPGWRIDHDFSQGRLWQPGP